MANPSENSRVAPAPSASHRILKKFAYLLSARWIREAIQTIFLIYLARHSTTTYGEFMLALGLGDILLLIGQFGLNLPLVSLLSRKEADRGGALSQVFLLKTGLLACAWIGVMAFVHWQSYNLALKQVILALAAGVGLEALGSTFFVACQVEGRQDLEGKIRTLAAGIGFGYGLLTLSLGAPVLVVAFFKMVETLVNLVGGGLIVFQGRYRLKWPALGHLGATLRRAVVFALIEVTAITYNKANLFFLQRYAGSEGVAQYSVTWGLVDGFSSLVSNLLLQSVIFPLFVQLWDADRPQVTRLAQNTARWLLAAACPLMFLLFIESDRVIPLVFGARYQDAVWLQKYLVITVLFSFLHNLAAFLMISMRREKLLLGFYLAGLAVNLLWCSWFMPLSPLLGAALAMVLTKGAVAVMTVSYAQRSLGFIPARPLIHLGAAALGGACLYFLSINHLGREFAEALALAPTLALAWHWWRGR